MGIQPQSAPNPTIRPMTWLIGGSLAIIVLAAVAQTAAGAYEMTWRQAWNALTDGHVWRQPDMLARLLVGEDFAKILGIRDTEPLSTPTLIVWNVRLPRVLTGILVG